MKIFILITAFILSFNSFSFDWKNCDKNRPLSENDMKIVQDLDSKITARLPQNKTFYHWASSTGFKGLQDKVNQLNSKEFQKECRVKLETSLNRPYLSGHGIYMADNPYSSSQFSYDENGHLFEIIVSKGQPYFDIFNQYGISPNKLYQYPVEAIISTREGNVGEKQGWWINKLTSENSYQVRAVDVFSFNDHEFAHILFSLSNKDFSSGKPYLIEEAHNFLFPRIKKHWDSFLSQRARAIPEGQLAFAGFGLCALKKNGKIFLTLPSECVDAFKKELSINIKNIPKGSDILTFSQGGMIVAGGLKPDYIRSDYGADKYVYLLSDGMSVKPVLFDGLAPFSDSLRNFIINSAEEIKKQNAMFREKRNLKTIELAEKLKRQNY